MPRHDVAIYAPDADRFYDATRVEVGGGAERQTFLLATTLAEHGLRVAHVVYPVASPRPEASPVTLVEEPRPERQGTPAAFTRQTSRLWRALSTADASVVVVRGASGAVGAGAAWCRAHRRRLVFATANESDFGFGAFEGQHDPRAIAYGIGRRFTDAIVVQSDAQMRLAREFLPGHQTQRIASFVQPQPATRAPGEAFLWISRPADYKRPMAYVDLAAAVPEARFWMLMSAPKTPTEARLVAEVTARAEGVANLDLLAQRPHSELQALIARAAATVNTSSVEGVPNIWLEGWSHGVPALTLSFDPDERVARHGLGISAAGDWDAFVAGAQRLWAEREDRAGLGPAVRDYVADAHGTIVAQTWVELVRRLMRSPSGAHARG